MAAELVNADGQPVAPQAPQFPTVNFNLSPEGMKITILLGPGLTLAQDIPPAYMDRIEADWRNIRSEVRRMQSLVNDVMRTKAR